MSAQTIKLGSGERIATEQAAHGGQAITHFQHVVPSRVGVVPRLLPKYLATSGGSIEMAVNGSVTPVHFDLKPAAAQILRVNRLCIVMSLAAQPLMTQFGTVAALANGVTVQVLGASDALLVDLLGGQPLKSNDDLTAIADFGVADLGASHTVKAEWRFTEPLRLEELSGGAFEVLRLSVRDNLTGLSRMRAFAECVEETVLT